VGERSAAASITVTIRYFAAARAAAGVPQEELAVAGRGSVDLVLAAAVELHGPQLAKVLQRCSFLLDEVAVHSRRTPVLDGQVLDVLPPFAGG
jgi:molybdopterin converting factor small subunit